MYFKINEELKIRSDKKLRDALHDIVTELKEDEFFDLGTISNILRHEYNIFLTPKLLERLLTLWSENKGSILTENDETWLYWDNENKIIENNLKKIKRSGKLGKSRRRLKRKEEEEIYKQVKKDGWIRLRDGRFVYNGAKTFKIDKNDNISISRYEKEFYKENENPITPDLIKNVFVLNHPSEADDISNEINNIIKDGIESSPKNGKYYYDECFNILRKIADDRKLDYKRGWDKKYAPTILKERFIKRDKKIKYEKELELKASKELILDKEKAIDELKNSINIDNKYYLIATKYNTTKNKFYIKKLLFGYLTVSDDKYPDGFYKIVMRNEKNGDDIVYFNTIIHLKKCIESGLKGEKKQVFNILKNNEFDKLKIYFTELKKYKGWDEYIEKELINKIKADF